MGVELESIPGDWEALADPVEVFSFDFYEHEANMAPAEKRIEFAIALGVYASATCFSSFHRLVESPQPNQPIKPFMWGT